MKQQILYILGLVIVLNLFSRCDESDLTGEIDTLYVSSLDTLIISETDTIYISEADTLLVHVKRFSSIADASIFLEHDFYSEVSLLNNDIDTFNAAGASQAIRVGASVNNDYYSRGLVKFDVTEMPTNATIISATLDLVSTDNADESIDVFIHRITEEWTEGETEDCCSSGGGCSSPGGDVRDIPTGCYEERIIDSEVRIQAVVYNNPDVTWIYASHDISTPTLWTTPGGSFISEASASSADTESNAVSFSSEGINEDIYSWINGESENFGWIIKSDEDELKRKVTEDGTYGGVQYRYGSKESSKTPILTIIYMTKE